MSNENRFFIAVVSDCDLGDLAAAYTALSNAVKELGSECEILDSDNNVVAESFQISAPVKSVSDMCTEIFDRYGVSFETKDNRPRAKMKVIEGGTN